MIATKELDIPGYERVIEAFDEETGLHCFIAIHNTTLGPALGGVRIYPYNNAEEALNDVLRLAKAMTMKSAIAQLGLGGGKSVIMADPRKHKTRELLLSFGRVINSLQGQYIGAEDIGSTIKDMSIIHETTPYIAALPTKRSSGDPSRFTAWGTFRGIQAVAKKLWGTDSLSKKKIAIQGLGSVGSKLAEILFWHGAELTLCDIDSTQVEKLCQLYQAKTTSPQNFPLVECDILSPCAMGGTINKETIPLFRCKAVAGSANNQLFHEEDSELLLKRGILYAPDFIINSGGIINAAMEFDADGYNPNTSRDKVDCIYDTLSFIFNTSEQEKKSTNYVAKTLAEYNLEHKINKRLSPISFGN